MIKLSRRINVGEYAEHTLAKAKNPDFRPIFQQALDYSSQRVKGLEDIFNSIHHPIPVAFGEKDADINAGELFSESFMLTYTKSTNKFIIGNYIEAYSNSSRSDVRQFFSECIDQTRNIINMCTDVLLAKGLDLKAPYLIIPDTIDFVDDKDYYGSIFGNNRPLNSLEIGHLHNIIANKLILGTLTLGLAQVAKNDKIRKYLAKGNELCKKQVNELSAILSQWDLPVPSTSDFEISSSTDSPFSDRLIIFHTTVVTAYTISNYGKALTNGADKEIIKVYMSLISELLTYAKDGLDLMIENRWLERVPETADRRKLVH